MAAMIGSSQPFPLRQICLNDLLNADLSSIVTSLSQPHGKMEDRTMTCSKLIVEGNIEHRWDLNQAARSTSADVENDLYQNGTTDMQRSSKLFSPDPTIEVGGTVSNSLLERSEEHSFSSSDIVFLRRGSFINSTGFLSGRRQVCKRSALLKCKTYAFAASFCGKFELLVIELMNNAYAGSLRPDRLSLCHLILLAG
jgi:hypothetical protein